MKHPGAVLCVLLLLAGCGSAPVEPQPVVHFVCPPFHAWSEEDLKALGRALEPVPADSIVMRMALDWRRYYGDAKACEGAQNQ